MTSLHNADQTHLPDDVLKISQFHEVQDSQYQWC